MHVHEITLDIRPLERDIIYTESGLPMKGDLRKGSKVILKRDEVRMIVELLDVAPDNFFLGQVTDFDGVKGGVFEGMRIGGYLRFQEKHVISCHF